MARKPKQGLDFFPMDVMFFQDQRVKKLRRAHGPVGLIVYVNLLCRVYSNGYQLEFDSLNDLACDICEDIMSDKMPRDSKKIEQIILDIGSLGLCNLDLLEKGVITSDSIKKQYIGTLKKTKRVLPNAKISTEEIGISTEEMQNLNHFYGRNTEEMSISTEEKGISTEEKAITSEEIGIYSEEMKEKGNENKSDEKAKKTELKESKDINKTKENKKENNSSIRVLTNTHTCSNSTDVHLNDVLEEQKEEPKNDLLKDFEPYLEHESKDDKKRDLKEARELFDIFWSQYPRKQGKQKCLNWFEVHRPDQDLVKTMLKAISVQRKSDQWKKNNGMYIPMPITWLHQARWEDEMEVTLLEEPKEEEPVEKASEEEIQALLKEMEELDEYAKRKNNG